MQESVKWYKLHQPRRCKLCSLLPRVPIEFVVPLSEVFPPIPEHLLAMSLPTLSLFLKGVKISGNLHNIVERDFPLWILIRKLIE